MNNKIKDRDEMHIYHINKGDFKPKEVKIEVFMTKDGERELLGEGHAIIAMLKRAALGEYNEEGGLPVQSMIAGYMTTDEFYSMSEELIKDIRKECKKIRKLLED